jgi:hypothetical protein
LHLEPRDKLRLESLGERLTLRRVRSASPLRKKRGIWCCATSANGAIGETELFDASVPVAAFHTSHEQLLPQV